MRIAALCCALAVAVPARADKPFWMATPQDGVALDPAADLAIVGSSLLVIAVPELLMSSLAPAHCLACNGPDNSGLPGDPQNGQASLNAVDAFFHDQLTNFIVGRKTADTASTVLVGTAVVAALGGAFVTTGPHASEWAGLRAALIVGESTGVALAAVQGVKFLVARKRPFVRYGHGTDGSAAATGSSYDVTSRDSHLGFPSGHTTVATSLGVSLAMTATLEESQAAPYLWGAAGVVAVAVGSLRIIAEKHYFTDVAVGALAGAGSGVILPWLHAKGGPLAKGVSVSVAPDGGPALSWAGQF